MIVGTTAIARVPPPGPGVAEPFSRQRSLGSRVVGTAIRRPGAPATLLAEAPILNESRLSTMFQTAAEARERAYRAAGGRGY